jgi:hypothetical protein
MDLSMPRVWQPSRLGSRAERADGRPRGYRGSVKIGKPHMSSGDVMKSKPWANHVVQSREWVLGSAVALLLISAGGLALLAQHAREQANVAILLLVVCPRPHRVVSQPSVVAREPATPSDDTIYQESIFLC